MDFKVHTSAMISLGGGSINLIPRALLGHN